MTEGGSADQAGIQAGDKIIVVLHLHAHTTHEPTRSTATSAAIISAARAASRAHPWCTSQINRKPCRNKADLLVSRPSLAIPTTGDRGGWVRGGMTDSQIFSVFFFRKFWPRSSRVRRPSSSSPGECPNVRIMSFCVPRHTSWGGGRAWQLTHTPACRGCTRRGDDHLDLKVSF